MKIAFYKGTRPGVQGLYSRAVRFVDGGPYSHCELFFSDGVSASASYMDGGVRFNNITYDPSKWDVFAINDCFEYAARKWFDIHQGEGYDLLGNLRFLLGIVRESEDRWFCSEAVAAALGVKEAYRLGPNGLAALVISGFFD